MHVTTKETDENGVHILASQVEADGPFALCSEAAKLSAEVVSIERTASGGFTLKTAIKVTEPVAVPVKPTTPDDQALEYLGSKGITGEEAKKDLEKFGASRILAAKSKAEADKNASLDEELAEKLS